MVLKCCVPKCKGNYDNDNKVHVFKFPKDEVMQQRWLRAIPRQDYRVTNYSVVCHRHFKASDVLWEVTATDSKTGKTLTASLPRPRLSENAIPCIFPNCPSYLSSHSASSREEPDKKRSRINKRVPETGRTPEKDMKSDESWQEDNEFTLGLKVEDSSNGLNSEEVFHSQSRIEQEHMEQPSRSTFADVEIALLHLHQEKLLLELEKISEERERIATEKKNIILHSEILKLRLQLAGCFRLAQMGINSVNTNAGTEDFLQNVNVSVSSHSVQQIQDSSTVKTKSSASALGTESKLPQLLPSKTRVSVCPEKPLIKIPPNMNSQPIHKQCSSTSNYPASFLPNKRPFLSDTVENLCLFPVTIPSSASHFLAPLLNIEGLSPPMTHLNIVQTDINNDKTSGISGSSQIGLVLQDCNSQQERLLFAKPSSQSMPATNSKDVHAISPTSIAGLDPPPIAFSKTILNQMVNSSLLNSSSRLERSRKAQESTDDFLSPYSKDSSVERNKCIFVTSSDSKAGSVPKVKEKVDIAGPSKKLRLSTEDSR
ncbi:uncharacterized protein [Anabrus simplex]|uniref:uncharacterized protein isoform X2 n=1 Tax=Anabrus simplex TaxID=316456 RepID=UPI0035A38B89